MSTSTPSSNHLGEFIDRQTADYPVMVLLVDDQTIVGEAIRRFLANETNIDFHFCAESHQALHVAETMKPTVILQDLVMPGLDGLTLVRNYRSNPITKDIPIIVLSTKEDPKVKRDAFTYGANDYLVKLPDALELVARIRYHSKAYQNQLQRDEAYRALRESQQKLIEANLELQRLSNMDGLTGLSNRRHFDENMDTEWRRSTRDQTPLAVLIIDVDCFKSYNDTYGHLEGDRALRSVAQTIKSLCMRPGDMAARYGGEEFAVILPGTASSGALAFGEKIRLAVESLNIPHTGSTFAGKVTISIGAHSMVPAVGQTSHELLQSADEVLYQAKKAGRNRVLMRE